MSVDERDPHSGYKTTGHDWNGIKELNTPVPRPVYFFLIAAFLFSVVYWVLMPAWPTGLSYTKGLLGIDQQTTVEREVARAAAERAPWMEAIVRMPLEEALSDPALMTHVRATGATLFGDNCAVCHGQQGAGASGYPNLRDDIWIWGGAPDVIAETLRVGVNSGHADARISQMPAFGRDQLLPQEDVRAVVAYVQSLSEPRASASATALTRGAEVFATTCASCHGARGEGMPSVGAPDLTDNEWLYSDDADAIFSGVWQGHQGVMPAWEGRLSPQQRRLLTLYLLDQQGRAP